MNNNAYKDIARDAKGVRLSLSEKKAIRRRILSRAPSPISQSDASIPSPYVFWSPFFRLSGATLAVLLITGIPLTYAAQGSAPGDMLYGFEVAVIEEVEERFVAQEHETEFHEERLEERLDEIKRANAKNEKKNARLSKKDALLFSSSVEKHADEATESLEAETDSARRIDRLVRVAALLDAQEEVFEDISEDTETLDEVGDAIDEVLDASAETYAALRLPKELTEEIGSIIKDISADVPALDPAEAEEVAGRLDDIVEQLSGGDVVDAFLMATDLEVGRLGDELSESEKPAGEVEGASTETEN